MQVLVRQVGRRDPHVLEVGPNGLLQDVGDRSLAPEATDLKPGTAPRLSRADKRGRQYPIRPTRNAVAIRVGRVGKGEDSGYRDRLDQPRPEDRRWKPHRNRDR